MKLLLVTIILVATTAVNICDTNALPLPHGPDNRSPAIDVDGTAFDWTAFLAGLTKANEAMKAKIQEVWNSKWGNGKNMALPGPLARNGLDDGSPAMEGSYL